MQTFIDELDKEIDDAKYYDRPVSLATLERLAITFETALATQELAHNEEVESANQIGFQEGMDRACENLQYDVEQVDPDAKNEGISALIKRTKERL